MRASFGCLIVVTLCLSAQGAMFGMQAPAPGRGAAAIVPPQPNPTGPLYQHKGEQYRVYNFPGTGESIPYRLFVPSKWTPDMKLPMLVTLRAGNTVDGPYRAQNDLVKHAEQRGYIVVTPMGYRPLEPALLRQRLSDRAPQRGGARRGLDRSGKRTGRTGCPVRDRPGRQGVQRRSVTRLSSRAEPVGLRRSSPGGQVSGSICRAGRQLGSHRLRHLSVRPDQGEDGDARHPRGSGHGQPDRRRHKRWPMPPGRRASTRCMPPCREGRTWRRISPTRPRFSTSSTSTRSSRR